MNNEVTVRTISAIADEINVIKSQTSGILTAALTYVKRSCFEIGKRLEEAKALVPHGEWGEWLEENFEYSESTAGNLMRIYREFGNEQIDLITGKSPAETFEGLSQSQLVELFALPKGERADFVEAHRQELEDGELSIREMRELIRQQRETIEKQEEALHDEIVEKARITEQAEFFREAASVAEAKEKERQLKFLELEEELNELKNAPKMSETVPEIVYEPTKKQIKEIRDKAIAETEKRLKRDTERLTADLEEKEKIHAKAIEDLQEENLKKIRQLTQRSDPHSARVGYCMEAIARALNDINAEVAAMEQESAGSGTKMRMRCESSLLGLLNRCGWQV